MVLKYHVIFSHQKMATEIEKLVKLYFESGYSYRLPIILSCDIFEDIKKSPSKDEPSKKGETNPFQPCSCWFMYI